LVGHAVASGSGVASPDDSDVASGFPPPGEFEGPVVSVGWLAGSGVEVGGGSVGSGVHGFGAFGLGWHPVGSVSEPVGSVSEPVEVGGVSVFFVCPGGAS